MKTRTQALAAAIALLASGAALADKAKDDAMLALATKSGCMTCHHIEPGAKGPDGLAPIGPAWKDVAAKYAGQKDAVDKLAAKIIKGGSGVWGPVPMPANAQVNDADAKKLAAWVLTLK